MATKRNEFEALVAKHGGSCGSGVTKKTTLLVTTPSEIATQTAKVVKAQELSSTCSIVSEDFVNDSIKKKRLQNPSLYSLVGGAKKRQASSSVAPAKKKKAAASSSNIFEGLTFCFSGRLSQKRSNLKALVASYGATSGDGVTKKTTHLVTTQEDFDAKTAKITKAESLDIPIISEGFIHDSIRAKKLEDSSNYTLGAGDEDDDDDDGEDKDDNEEKGCCKWIVDGLSSCSGLYVDENICICGDENGWLLDVDHNTGAIKNKIKLPVGVKAIVRDRGGFLYAGCHDGSVWYDCTNLAAPRQMRAGSNQGRNEIQWADIFDGHHLLIDQYIKKTSIGESDGIMRMQFFNEHLYFVTTNGSFGCLPLNNTLNSTKKLKFDAPKNASDIPSITSTESIEVAAEAKAT
eukprot:TRINITY_DN1129_c0_g8_i1.p1 TRINITY_DN1129_c0_g8~~TRINITY_DN1129_c0_g8_i1.p1  ORF type:complete len:440 (+),score=113.03 TRINITY_DN1129_c0_g8_i1:111-1322(+)